MRLIGLLTHAGNLLNGFGNFRQVSRQDFSLLRGMNGNNFGSEPESTMRRFSDMSSIAGSTAIPNQIYTTDENVYDPHTSLAKLKAENYRLKRELEEKCQLIDELNNDMARNDYDKLLCMIVELYHRMKMEVGQQLVRNGEIKDGVKIDGFLESARKGSTGIGYPNGELLYWMAEFENSAEMKALRDFRNHYAHATSTDLNILEQWKTRLLRESMKYRGAKDNSNESLMAEAALAILRKATIRFSRNNPKMLDRKRLKYDVDTALNAIDLKASFGNMSKKERKNLLRSLRKPHAVLQENVLAATEYTEIKYKICENVEKASVSELSFLKPINPFDAYHSNSAKIGELRKVKEKSLELYAEIENLRKENKKLIEKYGDGVVRRARNNNDNNNIKNNNDIVSNNFMKKRHKI